VAELILGLATTTFVNGTIIPVDGSSLLQRVQPAS
jgi:hypothetical protein